MNPNIYNRPMFQNPQQRAGGGIMAGVAPINFSNGGSTWGDVGSSLYNTASGYGNASAEVLGEYGRNIYDGINMPSPGELGFSVDDDGIGFDSSQLGEFYDEQSTPSDGGIFGIVNGEEITARDAFNFLVVDKDDPVDLAIASASVALLAVPFAGWAAAGAATLGRYGYKGAKAFNALKKLRQGDGISTGFVPSADAGSKISRFLGKRVSPTKESLEKGIIKNLVPVPGERAAQYQTNRLLGELGEGAIDLVIPSARADETAEFEDSLSDEDKNLISSSQQQESGPVETAGIAAIDTQDPQITDMVREAETDAEGGIAKVARSIAEARSDEFKSPTFRRGDKDLAAVTKEDLIDSGYEGPDALTNYLNDMKFDDELGEYIKDIEAEGKANGGIMRLKNGKFIDFADSTFGKVVERYNKRQAAAKKAPWREQDLQPTAPNTRTKTNVSDNKPVLPDGDTATKDGMIKKGLKSTGTLGLYGAAAYGGYKLLADLADNAEEELSTAVAGDASAAEIEALKVKLADANKKLAEALEDNTTNGDTTDGDTTDEGNPLKQLFSKVRKGLSFDDPQKALYIAGQMMKPTEGFVPVNAFTAGTEAAIAYDKNKSEMARDQASVNSTMLDSEKEYELRLAKIEAATGEKLPDQQRLSLYEAVVADARGQEDILTLMKYQPDQLTDEILNRINRGNADIVTAQIMDRFQTSVPTI
mgnify:CR=1 FL=1